jgi:hypothetical protein
MLVAAADIGGDNLQNDAMLARAVAHCQFRKIDGLDLHLTGANIRNTSIAGHSPPPS